MRSVVGFFRALKEWAAYRRQTTHIIPFVLLLCTRGTVDSKYVQLASSKIQNSKSVACRKSEGLPLAALSFVQTFMTMPTALTHRASIKHCTRNSPTSILSVRQYGGHTRAMSDGGLEDRGRGLQLYFVGGRNNIVKSMTCLCDQI